MADVNLTPGSMASVGGRLTDAEDAMTSPGSTPGDDPSQAPGSDDRKLVHGEPGGEAEGTWTRVGGRPWGHR